MLEWGLFYLSEGWSRPLPTTVGTSLCTADGILGIHKLEIEFGKKLIM